MVRRSSLLASIAVLLCAATARADSWSDGASLTTSRLIETLATLHDGSILAIGGNTSFGTASASVERYDPGSGTWAAVASMNAQRRGPLAVTLADGRVLVAGPDTTAEVYSPSTNTWTPTSNGMRDPRVSSGPLALGNGIARMGDGRVLLAGASATATARADIFDPSAGSGAGAFVAAHDMGTPRDAPVEATLPDGRVLVAGGANGPDALATGEVYDPVSNTWTPVANSMVEGHAGGFVAPLPGGKVLVFGGLTGSGSAFVGSRETEVYDPATNRFTPADPMNSSHFFGFAAPLGDGRILAGAGATSTDLSAPTPPAATNDAEIYSPASGAWTPTARLPRALMLAPAATLPTGQVIVVGGSADLSNSNALAQTEIFTPSTAPAAPRSVWAAAGDGSATVSWASPASDGGAAIDHYTVTASTGQVVATPDARTTLVVGGLANGRAVTFTVTAHNAVGTGPGATSSAVTPTGPDRTPPALRITRLHSKLELKSFLRGVTATVKPSEAASLSVSLLASARKATIARAYNLTLGSKCYRRSASTRHIKVKPSRRLVDHAHRFSVRLRIVATDAAGNARTVTKTVRVAR